MAFIGANLCWKGELILIFTTLMVVEWFEIRGRGICVGHNLKGNG
jgi:hypothetical protein